jgi:UDP-N-acetylglucosamine diphosphorylase/glucosamine-1-phosphate N-acetyltransferase
MRLCVFEDDRVAQLEPVALTRPAFDLRCGAGTLLERLRRLSTAPVGAAWVRPHLTELCRLEHPGLAINEPSWWRLASGQVALVNARWLPFGGGPSSAGTPTVGVVDDDVAYAVLPAASLEGLSTDNIPAFLDECKKRLPHRPAGGCMVSYPWDLVELNAEALEQDYRRAGGERARGPIPEGVVVVGPAERAVVHPEARVEPLAVIDTTRGPVLIDKGAIVQSFSRLEGPCYVGPGTHVLGAKVRGGSLGPHCRIGGEVEASIVHGYSNKAHEGFLGHAYVGEWVNFGAGTQNSDLRNDYASVSVTIQGRKVDTGLLKVGAFIGDHVKTTLNTLLNTGSVIGPFAHLVSSGGLLPRALPAFAQFSNGEVRERTALREAFATAATVMARRGREWLGAHAALFLEVYEQTLEERRRAIHDAEVRRLRRVG